MTFLDDQQSCHFFRFVISSALSFLLFCHSFCFVISNLRSRQPVQLSSRAVISSRHLERRRETKFNKQAKSLRSICIFLVCYIKRLLPPRRDGPASLNNILNPNVPQNKLLLKKSRYYNL